MSNNVSVDKTLERARKESRWKRLSLTQSFNNSLQQYVVKLKKEDGELWRKGRERLQPKPTKLLYTHLSSSYQNNNVPTR